MTARRFFVVVSGVIACADGGRITPPTQAPAAPAVPSRTAGILRATVDEAAGTLTFKHLAPGGDVELSGIYGDQGLTVRLFNSPVTVSPVAGGKKRFSAAVGLQNLQPFPIGDEQGGPAPPAIMGIYAFVNGGPTVTATSAPCNTPCTVAVQNHHGTLDFNAIGQKYWYWDERVGAAGSGSDTTGSRRTWVFEADAQVTGFQFDVLLNAGWPPPHDTRWKTQYGGDSLPDQRAEPRWGLTNTSGTYRAAGGVFNITTDNNGEIEFYRLDSLASTTSAYAEARIRLNATTGRSLAVIHFRDRVKFVALGIEPGLVGFIRSTGSFPFIASWPTATDTFHVYQLRKYAADSAVILVDGERLGSVVYDDLSATPFPASSTRFQFGSPRVSGASNSDWDYVIFEIGVPTP